MAFKKKGKAPATEFPVPAPGSVPDVAQVAAAAQRAIRPQQSLNEIEEALRRHYGLVGEIRASLDPVLNPVIIVGDTREPGHAVNKGRSWAWANQQGAAVGINVLSVLFHVEVLIEGLYADLNSAAQGFSAYITAPGETIPIAVTAAGGTWTDRKNGASDIPPFNQTTSPGALTGTAETNTNRVAAWGNTPGRYIPIKLMLPAESALTWRSNNTQAWIAFGMHGRIFP